MGKSYEKKISAFLGGLMMAITPLLGGTQQPLVSPLPAGADRVGQNIIASPTPMLKKEELKDKTWQSYLDSTLLPLTRQHKVPDKLAASQAAQEGGRKLDTTNPFGLMYKGKVMQFPNLEAGVKAYARTLETLSGGLQATDSAKTILQRIQPKEGKAYNMGGDRLKYINLLENTPEYRRYGE